MNQAPQFDPERQEEVIINKPRYQPPELLTPCRIRQKWRLFASLIHLSVQNSEVGCVQANFQGQRPTEAVEKLEPEILNFWI